MMEDEKIQLLIGLNTDISAVKTDINDVKTDISAVYDGQEELKTDISADKNATTKYIPTQVIPAKKSPGQKIPAQKGPSKNSTHNSPAQNNVSRIDPTRNIPAQKRPGQPKTCQPRTVQPRKPQPNASHKSPAQNAPVKPRLEERSLFNSSLAQRIASGPCLDLPPTCNLCNKLHLPLKCKARFYFCYKCGEARPLCRLCNMTSRYQPRERKEESAAVDDRCSGCSFAHDTLKCPTLALAGQ
jgi:hypothetical protein